MSSLSVNQRAAKRTFQSDMAKKRLDSLMVEKGLSSSREKAKISILMGEVFVNGQKVTKPSMTFLDEDMIEFRGEGQKYVSRGGYKLEKAMEAFSIELEGRVCADIGSSTGGFTDCMLQNGAKRVFAVDVGYGQLAWKLRSDERVTVMERVNARYLTPEDFEEAPSFASIDVSFISLKLIVPALAGCGIREIAALIKPQFEAGREEVGKKGIIRDRDVHMKVIRNVQEEMLEAGYSVTDITYSPIKGQDGNIEFLGHFMLDGERQRVSEEKIRETVEEAHSSTARFVL